MKTVMSGLGESPLDVKPDAEGIKRRQAEFLVLYYLRQQEVASKSELKTTVKSAARKIAQTDEEPPIYFNTTAGRATHQGREFNEVLDRCLHRNWVERTIEGQYGITDKGIQRLEEIEQSGQYEITQVLNTFSRHAD